jgi:hypothetical protein
MAQTLYICLMWMYEAVWSEYQPQPWCFCNIFTPQVTLSPQIWGQLGQCNGIRVQPCVLETAYQMLKHFVHVWWGYGKQSEVDISLSLNRDIMAPFLHSPLVTSNSQIWGQLGRCNGIRVHLYALETAYQWLKHKVVWSGYRPQTWCNDGVFPPQVTLTPQIWGRLGWCH